MVRAFVLISVIFFAVSASAFEILVSDSYKDTLYLLSDADGSGEIVTAEVIEAYTDEAEGPELSVPSDLCVVEDLVYLLDGGSLDSILKLSDADGDGSYLAGGDVDIFYGPECPGPELRTPSTLRYRDGVFTLVDDSTVRARILLLEDTSGDGRACTSAEVVSYYNSDQSGLEEPPRVPQAACILPDYSILVWCDLQQRIYRLLDLNEDLRIQGEGEIEVFYDTEGSSSAPGVSCLVSYKDGFLASDQENGSVLYLEDKDGNRYIDEEEIRLFCGRSKATPLILEPADLWVDRASNVWMVDNGTDMVYFMADRNEDGDALDAGEVLVVFSNPDKFSRPTGLAVLKEVEGEAPLISGISPSQGGAEGGGEVYIAGRNFNRGTRVYFGEAAAEDVEVEDAENLRVVAPPGSQTVSVTVASVTGFDVLPEAYNYTGSELEVQSISPSRGATEGGDEVTLSGYGLDRAEVWFDGLKAEVISRDVETLVVLTPAHEAGPATVLVSDGVTEETAAFSYVGGGTFVRGDVDADGRVAINDAIQILNCLFAGVPKPECQDRADVNDDGAIDLSDAISLLGYLFAHGEPPGPPFENEAADPTADELPCP